MEVLEGLKKELESLYPSLMTKIWFQQDGASYRTSIMSQEWLKTLGSMSSVSRPILSGPPISDLSPSDFFLLGYLKDKVYASKLRAIIELKSNIRKKSEPSQGQFART